MTSLKFYALLAVADLVGLFLSIWFGILPVLACFILFIMVCISLLEMMKGFNMRGKLGL